MFMITEIHQVGCVINDTQPEDLVISLKNSRSICNCTKPWCRMIWLGFALCLPLGPICCMFRLLSFSDRLLEVASGRSSPVHHRNPVNKPECSCFASHLHFAPLLSSLHWFLVASRIRFKMLMCFYKDKKATVNTSLKTPIRPLASEWYNWKMFILLNESRCTAKGSQAV